MFDADEPWTVLNEFLLTIFVPGIVLFVGLWAVFRLHWNGLLLSWGLAPIVPEEGAGAVAAGYGRFGLLVLLTSLLLVPYVAVYRRFVRQHLRERGVV